MSESTRVATAYLQIEGRPPGNTYDYGDKAAVRGVTNTAPDAVKPGCIVVKVKLRIPKEAWLPFAPEATIDVPAELIQHPIEVEAVEP
jgi:hypothetical protein